MKKFLMVALAIMVCVAGIFASGQGSSGSSGGTTTVTMPYFRTGQNVGALFFLPQVERFNQKYAGQYRLIIEELVQDMYKTRMQQLGQSGRLPALVDGGSPEWIQEFIIPNNMFIDLMSFYQNTPEVKAQMAPESVAYNTTKDGKLFSITHGVVRPIGLFYNPRLYQPSRPISQMTWEQVSAELGNNKIAFMTSENAWTTMLTLSSLIAAEPGGAAWLAAGAHQNPRHTNFNIPIMINAVSKLQQLLQRNASSNTLGAAYADAANSFMSMRSAIIANGSWMIGDFEPKNSGNWSNGFNGADVRGDVLPGNVVIGGPAVGYSWWIPNTATAREQELCKAFIAFTLTQDEIERFMLAEGGTVPGMNLSPGFLAQRAQNKLMDEYVGAVKGNTILAYNLGDVIPNSVFESDFGRLLPLLINGTYTAQRFCQELTIKAQEARR